MEKRTDLCNLRLLAKLTVLFRQIKFNLAIAAIAEATLMNKPAGHVSCMNKVAIIIINITVLIIAISIISSSFVIIAEKTACTGWNQPSVMAAGQEALDRDSWRSSVRKAS